MMRNAQNGNDPSQSDKDAWVFFWSAGGTHQTAFYDSAPASGVFHGVHLSFRLLTG